MTSEAAQKYCELMIEVKHRTSVIYAFIDGKLHAGFKPTTIEVVYLQFRKILELIALGSLVANKELFSTTYQNFSKYWNAELLVKDMERINPNFYPQPFVKKPSTRPGVREEWVERPNDYLTKDDLIKLYGKCGAILHSGNPYGSQIDYGYYESKMEDWSSRIMNLLRLHYISLVDDPQIYLIQMGSKDQPPNWNIFARASKLKL